MGLCGFADTFVSLLRLCMAEKKSNVVSLDS